MRVFSRISVAPFQLRGSIFDSCRSSANALEDGCLRKATKDEESSIGRKAVPFSGKFGESGWRQDEIALIQALEERFKTLQKAVRRALAQAG